MRFVGSIWRPFECSSLLARPDTVLRILLILDHGFNEYDHLLRYVYPILNGRRNVLRGICDSGVDYAFTGKNTWLSLSEGHGDGSFVSAPRLSLEFSWKGFSYRMAVINLNGVQFAACLWITFLTSRM